MNNFAVERRLKAWLMALIVATLTSACSVLSSTPNHGFMFDLRHDDQDAELLDYRYGDSKIVVAPSERVAKGDAFRFEAISGPIRRGDTLYMKWRNIPTGKIYEDTVDLKSRLPRDIEDHTIYPMIYGSQLYVFLISPRTEKRAPNEMPIGPSIYNYRRVVQIYPDLPKAPSGR